MTCETVNSTLSHCVENVLEEKKAVLQGEENCSSRRSGSFVGLHGMNWAHARYEVAVAVPAFRVVQDVHCSGPAFHTLSARKE